MVPLLGIEYILWVVKSILFGANFNFLLICLLCWQNCSSNPCMHKYKLVEFQFDPKIGRTTRRLKKEHWGIGSIADMIGIQNVGDLNPYGGINPINVQKDNLLPIVDLINAQRV